MNKKIIQIILAFVLPLFMYACTENDYGNADETKIPSITEYKDAFKVSVNQDSNIVTLSFSGTGARPVWMVDGVSHTDLTYKMVVAKAGTYSIEAKVSNKYGVSDGAVALSFVLNNTLVPKEKITLLCGGLTNSTKQWVWNSKVDGHFGCGENYGNPTGWWSCGANGKEGVGMYDDVFTFGYNGNGSSGTYTYDPGAGKTIYVNKDCTFSPLNAFNPHDGNDYQATVAVQNTTWTMDIVDEDLFITFPAGTFVGYVPNADAYNKPRFKVVNISNDVVTLVHYNGGIAWKIQLVSKAVFDAGGDTELDGSKYAAAIVGSWKWDETTDGHFGCGENASNPTGWWSCAAEGKDGYGLYDDVLTFNSSLAYTFDPGTAGTVYVNSGCKFDPFNQFNTNDGKDYQATVAIQNSTYTVTLENGKYYLTFPAKTLVTYVPSEEVYNNPKYLITKMTNNLLEFVSLGTGISWRYRFVRKS